MIERFRKWYANYKFRYALDTYIEAKRDFFEWRDRTVITHPGRKDALLDCRQQMHNSYMYLEQALISVLQTGRSVAEPTRTYFRFDGVDYVFNHERKTAIEKRIFRTKPVTFNREGDKWVAQESNELI